MGKVINRKTIKAGDLVQVVEYSRQLPRDTKRQRAAKNRASSEAQKRLNNKTAKGKLAFLLAANFTPRKDYFVTLTYSDSALPDSRRDAIEDRKEFLRVLRQQRKRRGESLKWVGAIENKHGAARWHHHLSISAADPALDLDELQSLWPYGNVHVSALFDQAHKDDTWFDLARYLTKERPEDGDDETPVGSRVFSCSRGLDHPQPHFEIVDSSERAELPKDAKTIDGLPQGDVTTTVDGIPIVIRYLTYQIRCHSMRT